MKKVALFAFNGDAMCFVHVLLNALDMYEKQVETTIVIEGAATRLIPELVQDGRPLFGLYQKVKTMGLVAGACKACATKMGTAEAARTQGLTLLDDMHGHPSIARFRDAGFDVITF
ncbi:MAG: cytoplasmic protein [Syntrophobacteraceae bacterium]